MPAIIQDNVKGALKLNALPERTCFTSFQDFVEQLPNFLSVEVPASVSNVVIGPSVPSQDDIDKLWVRRDVNGNFIGFYAFQNGAWRPFYNLVTQGAVQIIWLYGDSNTPPDGFTFIDTGDPVISPTVVVALKGQYVPNPLGGGFAYYAARFSGF